MQESTKPNHPPSLEALKTMFDQLSNRTDGKRRHLPVPFKERAVSAVRGGLSIASVAAACGVNKKSLATWIGRSKPNARVLKVCEIPTNSEKESTALTAARLVEESVVTIKLFFPNGVIAEFPTSNAARVLREVGGLKSC